jgi:internalin A
MKKIIALVSGLALLFQALPASAAPPRSVKTKTFAQWCQQRNSVPAATKLTIDLLLQRTSTKNCKLANAELIKLEDLYLSRADVENGDITKPISDLNPIASLTNLKNLFLRNHKIVDLKPLIGLNKLTFLDLGGNQIVDIKSLSSLTKLETLSLNRNQIANLKPLERLNKLITLDLSENKIGNPNGLGKLTSLDSLILSKNQIINLEPLVGLTKLKFLSLDENQISNLKPLPGLTNLKYAAIRLCLKFAQSSHYLFVNSNYSYRFFSKNQNHERNYCISQRISTFITSESHNSNSHTTSQN